MLYLSAQPDQIYFIWQLEIQLRNFHAFGITKDYIQVIVSYDKTKGLNPLFEEFIESNSHLANFFPYPDLRENPKYTSSIRPNVLKQHFCRYPELEQQTLFYHDSDILFSRIPQIVEVDSDEINYVSDTRNYLDVSYIRRTGSEQLLENMLQIVGLSKNKLEKEDKNTGGAQYVLKGVNAEFWEKVERDSEELYVLMKDYNKRLWEKEYPEKKEYRSKKRGIQAWCADMWALLWNLWLSDKQVKLHPEMDFSWPYSPIDEWDQKAIQHYSGNIKEKEKYFKKNEYLNYMPWYDSTLSNIPDSNCSYRIVELIQSRKEELDRKRAQIMDSCIVFDGRESTDGQLGQYGIIKTYIQKYITIDIYLLTNDSEWIEKDKGDDTLLLSTILNRNYKSILWMPSVYLMDIKDIHDILNDRFNSEDVVCYLEKIYTVDSLFTETFSKVLDMNLLHLNKGKFNVETMDSDKYIRYVQLCKDQFNQQRQLQHIYCPTTGSGSMKKKPFKSYRLIP